MRDISILLAVSVAHAATPTSAEFAAKAYQLLPLEQPYAFHDRLTHKQKPPPRDPAAKPSPDEMEIPGRGWRLIIPSESSQPLKYAAQRVSDFLRDGMQVTVSINNSTLENWRTETSAIIVAPRSEMPGCGMSLTKPKDYEIIATPTAIAICGYDERGAMYGLYHLQERFRLREAPFLPQRLHEIRHSLYSARTVISRLGWMEFPDEYLALLPQFGIDSIFSPLYANPLGAPGDPPIFNHYRSADPARVHDLIRRAASFGIDVYFPLMFTYTGTPENQERLRAQIHQTVHEFPEVRGYILLTEGFVYGDYGKEARSTDHQTLRNWIPHWTEAVRVATEEFHKLNPRIEVLPWDYSVNWDADYITEKVSVIQQYPQDVIPLITFETGKQIEFQGERGTVNDYSISVVGPSESAAAQIAAAKSRRMPVYAKADTWTSWQYGSLPYLPCPYQWLERYRSLENQGINGALESWTYGLEPNFVAELRTWMSWSDAPPTDVLLDSIAQRTFGAGSEKNVLAAWRHFSSAIRLTPDTGPRMGTMTSLAAPLFLEKPGYRPFTAIDTPLFTWKTAVFGGLFLATLLLSLWIAIRSAGLIAGGLMWGMLACSLVVPLANSPLLWAEMMGLPQWAALLIVMACMSIGAWAIQKKTKRSLLTAAAMLALIGVIAATISRVIGPFSLRVTAPYVAIELAAVTGCAAIWLVMRLRPPSASALRFAQLAGLVFIADIAFFAATPSDEPLRHSFYNSQVWSRSESFSPYWPYVPAYYLLLPDFKNQINAAETYAKPFSLPVFLGALRSTSEELERGLGPYRAAALAAPAHKQADAFHEVLIAEQWKRMVDSTAAVLEFEDLRFRLSHTVDRGERGSMLQRMETILHAEIDRTKDSLETARRDSRMGYEWEFDYFYSPAILQKKLELLNTTLTRQLPKFRRTP